MAIQKRKKPLVKKATKNIQRVFWVFPHNAERYYKKHLLKLSRAIKQKIKADLIPYLKPMVEYAENPYEYELTTSLIEREGGVILALNRILERMKLELFPDIEQAKTSSVVTFEMVSQQNKNLFVSLFRKHFMSYLILADNWESFQRSLFEDQNSKLINNMVNEEFLRVSGYVERGMQQQSSFTEIVKEINNSFDITDRKAELIARDQVAKLNASISMLRQEELGFKEYVWITQMDERVRATHRANQDRVFEWAHPSPITGHPGHDVNCRCLASPNLSSRTSE